MYRTECLTNLLILPLYVPTAVVLWLFGSSRCCGIPSIGCGMICVGDRQARGGINFDGHIGWFDSIIGRQYNIIMYQFRGQGGMFPLCQRHGCVIDNGQSRSFPKGSTPKVQFIFGTCHDQRLTTERYILMGVFRTIVHDPMIQVQFQNYIRDLLFRHWQNCTITTTYASSIRTNQFGIKLV